MSVSETVLSLIVAFWFLSIIIVLVVIGIAIAQSLCGKFSTLNQLQKPNIAQEWMAYKFIANNEGMKCV